MFVHQEFQKYQPLFPSVRRPALFPRISLTAFPTVTILGDWYEEGLISDVLFKDDI
jgi:hypothetical protein